MTNATPEHTPTVTPLGLSTLNALEAEWQREWLDMNERFQPLTTVYDLVS